MVEIGNFVQDCAQAISIAEASLGPNAPMRFEKARVIISYEYIKDTNGKLNVEMLTLGCDMDHKEHQTLTLDFAIPKPSLMSSDTKLTEQLVDAIREIQLSIAKANDLVFTQSEMHVQFALSKSGEIKIFDVDGELASKAVQTLILTVEAP